MTQASDKDGYFVVDLRGIELTSEAADNIARAIRQAALNELASLDIATPVSISFRESAHHRVAPDLSERPRGLWCDPDQTVPEE